MRRALLLSLLSIPATSFAVVGDWKIWSPVTNARMTVFRSNQTVLAATTGGVVSWDPATSTGKVMTGQDGLPTLDMAGIAADSSGNIWAVGVDGRMAVLEAGASFWTSVGSYASSGWQFSPGAVLFWNGYLVLGGPQGVSLFSTKNRVAADYASTFGSLRDTVTGVFAYGDSLWVSTPSGLAVASDPVWATDSAEKHIGTAGYFLNSLKWGFRSTPLPVNNPRLAYRVRRDSTGVHQVLAGQWANYDKALQGMKIDYGQFVAPDLKATVAGAQDAIWTPWGYFLSSSTGGLVQLKMDGSTQSVSPQGALPDVLPAYVAVDTKGNPFFLSSNFFGSTRIWKRQSGGNWIADTIRVASTDAPYQTIFPFWDISAEIPYHRKALAVGPQGEVVVASWVISLSHGGFFRSSSPGSWTSWNHRTDSCIMEHNPIDQPDLGTLAFNVHSSSDGVWGTTTTASGPLSLVFLPSSGEKPVCLEFDPASVQLGGGFLSVHDILPSNGNLWLSANNALVRIPSPRPSLTRPVAQQATAWHLPTGTTANALMEYRLGDRNWIIAAGSGALGYIRSDASSTDNFTAVANAKQSYSSLAMDALGQIWAAGDNGLEIYGVGLDTTGLAFTKIRSIAFSDGLPSSSILDMALDTATGKAIIATSSALALWTSPYHTVPSRLVKSSIRVWPNPVRLRQNKLLYIAGATLGAEFNLLSADGTLVLHKDRSQSSSGTFQIELPSTSRLRPGVYYWSLKDANGTVHGPLLVGE